MNGPTPSRPDSGTTTPDSDTRHADEPLECLPSPAESARSESAKAEGTSAFFDRRGDPLLSDTESACVGAIQPEAVTTTPPVSVPSHTLTRCLGAGGFGQVWLARHTLTEHDRACKLIPSNRAMELDGLKQLKRHARSHPGLMPIEEVGRVDDWLFVLMPLASNANTGAPVLDASGYKPLTLGEYVRRSGGLVPPHEVVDIGVQLIDAVRHLHRCGMTHGDIKPTNVLRLEDRWVIADYSLVRDISAPVGGGHTPGYVPPEGPGTSGADEFALGVVLMELLTGGSASMLSEFRTTPVWNLQSGPEGRRVREVILKATDDRPDHRFRSADAFRKALQAATRDSSSRRRGLLVAALVAALLAPIVWFAWSGRGPRVAPPNPASLPLVTSLSVEKYREDLIQHKINPAGTIGLESRAATLGDVVLVHANFRAPAYAFLLSLDTNGTVKLRLPDSDAEPPPLIATLDYPRPRGGQTWMYPLTDGPGVQGFLVIASEKRLPPYREWLAAHGQPHWPPATTIDTALLFDGRELRALEGTRGEPRPIVGTLQLDCVNWARSLPASADVSAIFLPVLPLNK